MIIVTGAIVAKPECLEDVRTISAQHVQRSRAEPGCIAHNVCVDVENERRLVFVEYWEDMPSLLAHFDLDTSQEFVSALRERVSESPEMKIFEAAEVRRN